MKALRKMKRRSWIAIVCSAVVMFCYPLAAQEIAGFPLWVVGWIPSLVGYWATNRILLPLLEAINDSLDEEKNEKSQTSGEGGE